MGNRQIPRMAECPFLCVLHAPDNALLVRRHHARAGGDESDGKAVGLFHALVHVLVGCCYCVWCAEEVPAGVRCVGGRKIVGWNG